MATVTGKSSLKIDDLINDTVIGGYVSSGGMLILVTRGGAELNAGVVTYPGSLTDGATWSSTANYDVNAVVAYGGKLYKSLSANLNKPPILYSTIWQSLLGSDVSAWSQKDSGFQSDSLAAWQTFWVTGGASSALTSVAGEFETGTQALKVSLPVSSAQQVYEKEENGIKGGDKVLLTVRAKLTAAATGVTLNTVLYQNDQTAVPGPFASGGVQSGSAEGAQTVTTSWATYRFTMTATNAKLRAIASLTVAKDATAGAATVVIDRIMIQRQAPIKATVLKPVVQTFTTVGANTWTKPANAVYVEVEVQAGGGGGGGCVSPAAGQNAIGGGGAGGCYVKKTIDADLLAATEPVLVGAGGTAGSSLSPGGTGGTSSFSSGGTIATSPGGGGGVVGPSNTFGSTPPGGGTSAGAIGDIMIAGSDGIKGKLLASTGGPNCVGGEGGTSFMAGMQTVGSSATNAGSGGQFYGGGGSAGYAIASGAAQFGGVGGQGIVIVTTYVAVNI